MCDQCATRKTLVRRCGVGAGWELCKLVQGVNMHGRHYSHGDYNWWQ
jgi:hypothetical protein